ncbi:MAG: hypothetical protein AVDCRST_MAG77-5703 [uncultured Chloroflexi bacterium]|uniref:Uncharacterized protein n=1 Tax=uncultured Chloroflexota bacterium TaxID=166587 RepID=A0A6J4KCG4_9CHLR|nr:MAG: hypothetical protein AVDCRST_MAG77-5703 [uncultured Chloroflexota bacterium]
MAVGLVPLVGDLARYRRPLPPGERLMLAALVFPCSSPGTLHPSRDNRQTDLTPCFLDPIVGPGV